MSKKIMIVDDSPIATKQLRKILEEDGHTVTEVASTGMEAIEVYKKAKDNIDVVTLDITMPTMQGNKVLEHIVEENPQAKVVMVSAVGKNEMIKECLQKGAKHFIVKPFEKEKILEVVNVV